MGIKWSSQTSSDSFFHSYSKQSKPTCNFHRHWLHKCDFCCCEQCDQAHAKEGDKCETRRTASVLKQNPNAIY